MPRIEVTVTSNQLKAIFGFSEHLLKKIESENGLMPHGTIPPHNERVYLVNDVRQFITNNFIERNEIIENQNQTIMTMSIRMLKDLVRRAAQHDAEWIEGFFYAIAVKLTKHRYRFSKKPKAEEFWDGVKEGNRFLKTRE